MMTGRGPAHLAASQQKFWAATLLDQRWRRALARRYARAPLPTAGVGFGLLAAIRIAGAFSTTLMVAAIVLTPQVLLVTPPGLAREMGLVRPRSAARLALGVAGVFGVYGVVVLVCSSVFGSGANNWISGIKGVFAQLAPSPGPAFVLAIVCMGVLIPLAEEVCFRGVLHHALAGRWGDRVAIVVTAAGWAMVHLGDYGLHPFNLQVIGGVLPSVFLMGLALGWCRVRTGSVVGSAAAQGIANVGLTCWVFFVF